MMCLSSLGLSSSRRSLRLCIFSFSRSTTTSTRCKNIGQPQYQKRFRHDSVFLQQVEETVQRVLQAFPNIDNKDISKIPHNDRETILTAWRLQGILQDRHNNGDDNNNMTKKCSRCWLIEQHCICDQCPSLEEEEEDILILRHQRQHQQQQYRDALHKINRIFVLMHHQEVFLSVDTSKLILSSFPQTARLVVSGMGPEYQDSMKEMLQAMKYCHNNNIQQQQQQQKCLVLFPTPGAVTYTELCQEIQNESNNGVSEIITAASDLSGTASADRDSIQADIDVGWDLIVIDGTWSQARKLHDKYIPSEANGGPRRIQLKTSDVDMVGSHSNNNNISASTITGSADSLGGDTIERNFPTGNAGGRGRQLRKHPIQWREISTLEALRLLLRDILTQNDATTLYEKKPKEEVTQSTTVWDILAIYHDIANAAARHQRGR